MINKQRVKIELQALAGICDDIRWDLDAGWIELHDLPFPPGWQPPTGAIRFELPETYPGGQPKAFLPEDMRYEGERPMIMLTSGPSGWQKHCIHRLELNPEYHTLVSMARLVETSLKQPNNADPLKQFTR